MPPRDDGKDTVCTCDVCMFGDRVNDESMHTSIWLCYSMDSTSYMKVRGDNFSCPNGESE